MIPARILGTKRYWTGSVARETRASICSVTRIEPISAAIALPDLPGDHQARQDRRQLAEHGERDDGADPRLRVETLEPDVGLEGEDRTREDGRQEDDREPVDADPNDLRGEGPAVEGLPEEAPHRQAEERDAAAVELEGVEREPADGFKEAHRTSCRKVRREAYGSREALCSR